jgi:hypothetical protein
LESLLLNIHVRALQEETVTVIDKVPYRGKISKKQPTSFGEKNKTIFHLNIFFTAARHRILHPS